VIPNPNKSHKSCYRTVRRRIDRLSYMIYELRTTDCKESGLWPVKSLLSHLDKLIGQLRRGVVLEHSRQKVAARAARRA
jgi:hypothetical protein